VDLGVYGAPESFLIDASGTIVYKRVGDVNRRVWQEEIKPHVDVLAKSAAAAGAPHG
jgi:cytochrome c biogenesis protein CcmG/thiol:disulfide interchange protein DsbE